MHPDTIFLRTLDDLASKLVPGPARDYNLLRAAALLRQLLLDAPALVHVVNRSRRLKLRFRVPREVLTPPPPRVLTRTHHMLGTPDADAEFVALDRFLRAIPHVDGSVRLTVRDIIDHVANVGGGVHYDDATEPNDRYLRAAAERQGADPRVIELPNTGVFILGIARIVIAALQPLREEIERPVRGAPPKRG